MITKNLALLSPLLLTGTLAFVQQKFDMNFTGPLKGGWKCSASIYQNVDPGSNASQIRTHKDRHRFYKTVVTKDFLMSGSFIRPFTVEFKVSVDL